MTGKRTPPLNKVKVRSRQASARCCLRPLAHPGDGERVPHLDVYQVAPGDRPVIDREAREAAQGNTGKYLSGTLQRALVLFPVELHDPVKHGTGQSCAGIGTRLQVMRAAIDCVACCASAAAVPPSIASGVASR